jgi:hypothetical protein
MFDHTGKSKGNQGCAKETYKEIISVISFMDTLTSDNYLIFYSAYRNLSG